ncbi:hypothetical protein [Paenibacillus sp. ACRRY]|uniref:hypothetical protein n=1 Tax=Paenibacillus sp. ACRRY TaxID=2918208 RepID=UPI001EF54C81|nr:hypothetical protein [Paenibacillus sp. ACRRY]MCG7385448.1 hypothetical protein [Paenibacillus sp. ACRRY]
MVKFYATICSAFTLSLLAAWVDRYPNDVDTATVMVPFSNQFLTVFLILWAFYLFAGLPLMAVLDRFLKRKSGIWKTVVYFLAGSVVGVLGMLLQVKGPHSESIMIALLFGVGALVFLMFNSLLGYFRKIWLNSRYQ